MSSCHIELAREGFLSGEAELGTRSLLVETLGTLRSWTRINTFASGIPKSRAILHPSVPGSRRYVLDPRLRGVDWDHFFHCVTPTPWNQRREALISIMGPCWVTAVALPLVLPGADAQDLHVDSTLPLFHSFNLAVQPDQNLHQGPETCLIPRSQGQRWPSGPHISLIPTIAPYFPWAERRAIAPLGNLLLWDAATVHVGPGRPLDGLARDSVVLFNIDCALTAGDAATLAEDTGPRRLRLPVRRGAY